MSNPLRVPNRKPIRELLVLSARWPDNFPVLFADSFAATLVARYYRTSLKWASIFNSVHVHASLTSYIPAVLVRHQLGDDRVEQVDLGDQDEDREAPQALPRL